VQHLHLVATAYLLRILPHELEWPCKAGGVVLNCKARNVASMSFLLLMVIAGLLERYSPNKGRS
jgi:hypothetical protein